MSAAARARERLNMFRMILGCAGVCLVALGLFGGGILDNAFNRFTGNGVADNSPVTAKVEVPAASESNSNTAVEPVSYTHLTLPTIYSV